MYYDALIHERQVGDRGLFPDRGRQFLPNRQRFPSNISNIYLGGANLVRTELAGIRLRPVAFIVLWCVCKLRVPGAIPSLLHIRHGYNLRIQINLSEPYGLI